MKLLERLVEQIPQTPIKEVIVGFHSVLVKSGDHSGIASTIKYCSPDQNVRHAGRLEALNLRELAGYSLSGNLLEASIGMAAINCGLTSCRTFTETLNAKKIILEKGKNKTVGIIGHFPFLEEQRPYYKNCYIFEKYPMQGDLTEEDIPHYLPKADVVAITGTSITNHTFEGIIEHLPQNSFNIVLGPSTPLTTLLFDYGIEAVSGSLVEDYEKTRTGVLQATPTRYLQGLKMVSIMKEGLN